MTRTFASAAFALSLLLSTSSGRAQPGASNAAAAESLYLEAEALVDKGQFALACPKYVESQRLDPQLGTLLHLADCYERNGQTASAWATFRESADLAKQRSDPRERVALARADALAPKLTTLAIVVPEGNTIPGLLIERDGVAVPASIWGTAVPVDPGKIRVRAQAPGYEPWAEEAEIQQPGKNVVTVPRLTQAKAPPPEQPVRPSDQTIVPSPPPTTSSGSSLKTVGWISGGVGLAVIATGAALSGIAVSQANDANTICPSGRGCTEDEIRRYDDKFGDAESLATAGPIVIGLGTALLIAGVAMILVAPSTGPTGARAPAVSRLLSRDLAW